MSNSGDHLALLRHGLASYEQGRFDEAAQCARQALASVPGWISARHLLGLALADSGRVVEATDHLRQVVQVAPQDADAWSNFGNVLRMRRMFEEAANAFRQALAIRPNHVEALNNVGFILMELGNYEAAAQQFRQAILAEPDFLLAHSNLGHALLQMNRLDEAIEVLERAIRRAPNDPRAYINLGDALRRNDRYDDALIVLQKAVQLGPNLLTGWLNLGGVLRQLGRLEESLAAYDRALAIQPDSPDARWNRSLVLLTLGRFREGWEDFEGRRGTRQFAPLVVPQQSPAWAGESLDGRSILMVAEQGLGDTVQFIRYARRLKQRGASRVIAAVQRPLLPLIARADCVDQVCDFEAALPAHDVHCLMLSLPRFLSPTLAEIPCDESYLSPDPELVKQWKERLAEIRGLRIGIGWQGSRAYQLDRYRSVPLSQFAPLAAVPNVQLICLQQGAGREQMAEAQTKFPVIDLGSNVDQAAGAFMDTAAILKNIDLLISSDTALVHVAGAIGVPVWVPLAKIPDWRFLLDRVDSPWYPSLRLFRQQQAGHWPPVFEAMAEALRRIETPPQR